MKNIFILILLAFVAQNLKTKTLQKLGSSNDSVEIFFSEKLLPYNKIAKSYPINVDIIFQHEDFIIINKPAGLITHAPHGKYTKPTLVDWFKSRFSYIDKPGIVHRLDKNTSGIMIVAKNPRGRIKFGKMFKNRQIQKEYLALVHGTTPKEGEINFALMRDPKKPQRRMAIFENFTYHDAKEAFTKYKTIKHLKNGTSLVLVTPKTGRTHQIRVHMASIGHPLVGDTLYDAPNSKLINRHALHAASLAFNYMGVDYKFEAPLPPDIKALLN
jgi:23S rRNA pseudouridine1911/1915/1917 synthase